MKDVRIVIVSWNVEKFLDRCLESLPSACEGLDWEIVVVDNASHDRSAEVAKQKCPIGQFCFAGVIANEKNLGFARAVNQGMKGSDARYVLLLNPDTECPPGSLTRLVEKADKIPKAGIFGPKLVYPNGDYQPSVRRFPGVLDQIRAYFSSVFGPVSHSIELETGEVDQVMGACFLIRRELIDDIGGLDERYFIWFEEVDYCRQAKNRGWQVWYASDVTVIHHRGQSFAQVFSSKKQRMFNDSLKKYFWKWHPGWRAQLVSMFCFLSMVEAYVVELMKKKEWTSWLLGIVALEIVSLATVFLPASRAIATIFAGTLMVLVAMRRPSLGLAILLLELAIGSKGALLKIPLGAEVDGGTSLRIVLTGTFLVGWFFGHWRTSDVRILADLRKKADVGRPPIRIPRAWVVLGILCVWALARGWWLHNPALFKDANAWGFLVLLLPVIDVASRDGKRLMKYGADALIAALLWIPVKTLALLYVWSHGIKTLSQPLYLWVRRTGVGEVTLVTGNLFRVFMQSQVYAVAGFLTGVAATLRPDDRRLSISSWILVTATSISITISLSRSLWIGLFSGGLALAALFFLHGHVQWKSLTIAIGKIFTSIAFAVGLIAATVALPLPRVDVGSLKTLFGSRGSVGDAAAESRWNLLPVLMNKIKEAPILGSGFGASVTYQSKDPRILAQNPDGLYTTYAFEWGWLEHWIKFGILGIPVMAWLVLSLLCRLWRLDEPWWLRTGFVSSLVALAALHVFTPYLNHPLGFGFLLAAEGLIIASKKKET